MARTKILTASGVGSSKHGKLYKVNISKVATGAGSVIIYDNATTNSGDIIFQGDGLAQASFDLTDGNGDAVYFTNGLYVSLAGTTNATVGLVLN